jgi:hypothetical protein
MNDSGYDAVAAGVSESGQAPVAAPRHDESRIGRAGLE